MTDTKVRSTMDDRFVWDPAGQRWLTPWDVTHRLHMPGVPCRWECISSVAVDDRIYRLTTREGGGVARQVKFRVSPAGWEPLEIDDIMWARNYMKLNRIGRRLEAYNPRRRKEPEQSFEKGLIWRVHEIGLKEALISLPEAPETTYAVSKRDLEFAQGVPTPLECRVQELYLLADPDKLINGHPLKWSHWLLEVGRKERYLLGWGGTQIYKQYPFEEWEDLRQNYDLTVDEALVAIQAGLGRMPDDGVDEPNSIIARAKVDRWHREYWSENDIDVIKDMSQLAFLQHSLIDAAMRAAESFKDFLAAGGSWTLPTSKTAKAE